MALRELKPFPARASATRCVAAISAPRPRTSLEVSSLNRLIGSLRMSILTRIVLTACLAAPAIAQPANPLEQSAPADPLKNDGRGAPAAAVAGAAGVPIDAPAFIKPGARLIYTHLSSMDKPFNLFTPWEKFGPQTVDGSIMASDVVAVLPDRVL